MDTHTICISYIVWGWKLFVLCLPSGYRIQRKLHSYALPIWRRCIPHEDTKQRSNNGCVDSSESTVCSSQVTLWCVCVFLFLYFSQSSGSTELSPKHSERVLGIKMKELLPVDHFRRRTCCHASNPHVDPWCLEKVLGPTRGLALHHLCDTCKVCIIIPCSISEALSLYLPLLFVHQNRVY